MQGPSNAAIMRELDRLKTSHNEVKVKQKNKHPDIVIRRFYISQKKVKKIEAKQAKQQLVLSTILKEGTGPGTDTIPGTVAIPSQQVATSTEEPIVKVELPNTGEEVHVRQ